MSYFSPVQCIAHSLEPRFFWCYGSLFVVGIGSVLFHGTLMYELQMADELPMIWASLGVCSETVTQTMWCARILWFFSFLHVGHVRELIEL